MDGRLRFSATPDYENTSHVADYAVTVQAAVAGQSSPLTLAVTATVVNIDDAGVVSLSAAQPAEGVALTATLSDPDGGVIRHHLAVGECRQHERRLDRYQRGNLRHLHTGQRRRGPLSPGHRLLRRRGGFREERAGCFGQPVGKARHSRDRLAHVADGRRGRQRARTPSCWTGSPPAT